MLSLYFHFPDTIFFFYLQQGPQRDKREEEGKSMQYQAVPDQHQIPQGEQWVMPPWVEQVIDYVNKQLNWLDLAFFALGALILLILLFILLRKRTRVQSETVEKYEEDIEAIKKGHLEEIVRAEKSIKLFKGKLEEIEAEFQKDLKKQEKVYHENLKESETEHSKRVQKIEKGHTQIRSTDELSIFELKHQINRLRNKQMNEVETFQEEIKNLKGDIEGMHEGHTKAIERAELEISDLRKQMHALMYRV
jgi:hypothetical protein